MTAENKGYIVTPKGSRFLPGNKMSAGRPKGVRTIPDVLRKLCAQKVQVNGQKTTKLEVIMMKVLSEALHGKSWAVQFVAERLEGKALQRSEVTTTAKPHDPEAVKKQILIAAAELQAWEKQKPQEKPGSDAKSNAV